MKIKWVNAAAISEEITRKLRKEYGCSRPSPRNKIMGFKGEPKKSPRNKLKGLL